MDQPKGRDRTKFCHHNLRREMYEEKKEVEYEKFPSKDSERKSAVN